ncbi:MAG: hypothetical protein JJV92_06510, partial [Desulfosarcina sp.]|nr:hypothetical protein [Desulfobacterales bacterium]
MGNTIRFLKWLGVVVVIIMIFAAVGYALPFNGSSIFPASIAVVGVFFVIGYLIFRDITDRKQTEQILQQRERYLTALNKAGSVLLATGREVPCQ